jgi:LmbE family N-acetylglucosaminyl deacetylase
MRSVAFGPAPGSGGLKLLCLGAHADDIEIGCGGTMLRLLAEYPGSACRWVVFSGSPERAVEARNSAALYLAGAAERRVDLHEFRDGHFPVALTAIKDALAAVAREFSPDVVFTHYRHDLHQDHRTISDVTWQTFRDHAVLEYEVPKYDGDVGQPNLYVPLSRETARRKVEHLLAAFPTQRVKRWFTEETFLALLRLRGIECATADGLAEAFFARKLTLGR